MTRTAQYFAVIGILVACLTVTAFGAIGAHAVRQPPAPGAAEATTLAHLDAVEPALTRLSEAAGRYAASADPASREALRRALAGLAEVRAEVERIPAGANGREFGQLLDAVRALVPRIHLLALEIADGATPEKLALLERLAVKTRTAFDQLREAAPRQAAAGTEKIASLAPAAPEFFVPEGVAVLFLTVVSAVSMALFSSRRYLRQ